MRKPTSRPQHAILALGIASLLAAQSALAATYYWDPGQIKGPGGGTGTWDTALVNWWRGGASNSAWGNSNVDTAILGGAAGIVSLGEPLTTNALVVSATSSTYTIQNNALTFAGSSPSLFNSSTLTLKSTLDGANGLTKLGTGTLTIQGSSAHTIAGGLTVNSGVVTLDYGNYTGGTTNMIDSGNSLTMRSGTLTVKASSASSSQTFNGLTLGGGAATLTVSTSAGTLVLGDIARNAAATVNFQPGTGTITTSAASLGNWASFGTGTGATGLRYATLSGGNVVAATMTPAADNNNLGDNAADNVDLGTAATALAGATPATVSANSIRFIGAASATAPGATGFTVNSLMNAGTGLWTIGPGNVTIGSTQELVLHPGTNGMAVSAVIQDNGNGASGLTVNGAVGSAASGALTLSGPSTYTGKTTINGIGSLSDGATTTIVPSLKLGGVNSELGAGTSIALNSGSLQLSQNGGTASSDRSIAVAGNSAIYVKNTFTQTLSGTISGTGSLAIDGDFASGGIRGGKGNVILTGDNSFSGDILMQSDSHLTLGSANAVKNATLNSTSSRSLIDLTGNLSYVIGGLKGGVSVNLGSDSNSTVSIGNNNQSNNYFGSLQGSAAFAKVGTGTQTLFGKNTYSGGTIVSGGTLRVGAVASQLLTGTTSTSNGTVTGLPSTVGLAVGQLVTGTGAGTDATIVSIDSATQVTLSAFGSAAGANSLTFAAQAATLGTGNVSLAGGVLEILSSLALGTDANLFSLAGSGTLRFDTSTSAITLDGGKYDFSAATITLDLSNQFNTPGIYPLITGGTDNVDFLGGYTFLNADTASNQYSFANGTLSVVQAVPEPGAWMTMLGAAATLVGLRRRRA